MKFTPSLSISWLLLLSGSFAISVKQTSLNLNSQRLYDGVALPAEAVSATIEDSKDVLEFEFKIDSSSRPHESILLLSDDNGLDYAVFPRYDSPKSTLSTSVAFSTIPQALRRQSKFTASLILANKDEDDKNVYAKIAEIFPSEEVREEASATKSERYGVLPEIHHIFRSEEPTINSFIPLVFSAVAGVLGLVLFVTWASIFGQGSMDCRGSTFKAAFLATLIAVEHSFLKYYLGASIFTTLFHVSILIAPSAIFGSKALRAMVQSRSA